MNERHESVLIAFVGSRMIGQGSRAEIAAAAKAQSDSDVEALLVFDAATSRPVEIDLRGSLDEVLRRISDEAEATSASHTTTTADAPRKPGRPRLGVVAREVTLLPRHWDWLAAQPGGASVTLRRLVEKARLAGTDEDRIREARESAYRFMFALGGNEPGFEEATRALYAGDASRFREHTEAWPTDVREHARHLAAPSFAPETGRD